jgi:hypothetical protein
MQCDTIFALNLGVESIITCEMRSEILSMFLSLSHSFHASFPLSIGLVMEYLRADPLGNIHESLHDCQYIRCVTVPSRGRTIKCQLILPNMANEMPVDETHLTSDFNNWNIRPLTSRRQMTRRRELGFGLKMKSREKKKKEEREREREREREML